MKPAIPKTTKTTSKSEITARPEASKKAEPIIRVIKSATCPSLSGKSKLTYEIGATESNELQLRIVANSGAGSFRQEWVELRAIGTALEKAPRSETVTSDCLMPLFRRESANMPSFVFAALLHAGCVIRSVREKRRYERVEPDAFDAAVKALMEGKSASANADAKESKAKGKKAVPDKTPSASTKKKK